MRRSVSVASHNAARICLSGHGRGCGLVLRTFGNDAAGSSARLPVSCSHRKNPTSVFRYPLRVSAFHDCEAVQCTRSSDVTS